MWRAVKVMLAVFLVVGFFRFAATFLRIPRTTAADVSGDGCLVLAYHRVIPAPWLIERIVAGQDDFTIYDRAFEQQMRTLKAAGVRFIRPEELESIIKRKSTPPAKCVLMTLDDADVSQY